MIGYPDTSFFFRIYDAGVETQKAIDYVSDSKQSLALCDLQHFEFTQAVRLRMFRYDSDRTEELSRKIGTRILEEFEGDLRRNFFAFQHVDFAEILRLSESISSRYTREHGYRSLDIIHVAAALHLSAEDFLTFDKNQSTLARAEGLKTPMQ